jgi:hypothetical protein
MLGIVSQRCAAAHPPTLTITGPQQDRNLGIQTFVNGTALSPVQINTTKAATDTIAYVATDQFGLTSTTTRTVMIEPAATPPSNAAASTRPKPNGSCRAS